MKLDRKILLRGLPMSLSDFLAQRATAFAEKNLAALRDTMAYPCAVVIDDHMIALAKPADYDRELAVLYQKSAEFGVTHVDTKVLRCRTVGQNGHAEVRFTGYRADGTKLCDLDGGYLCSRCPDGAWRINMVELVLPETITGGLEDLKPSRCPDRKRAGP
ncbi:hypothetical protein ABMC89_16815 [Sulfitobacter sp. HNIBRBA3233]|uniref:hypothetical protein n=1 Tax=Sulfitobacter marinivivus TaxID=3158558 RepID=UPI0032DE4188